MTTNIPEHWETIWASAGKSKADLAEQGWKAVYMPGFVKTAGPYLRREIEGAVEYGFIPGPEHLNPVNVVHGGCSFTFTDCALGWEPSSV